MISSTRFRLVLVLLPALIAGFAPSAFAWKPITHADEARKAVAAMPDSDPLKATLLANIEYVYAGSVGPDLFYALFPQRTMLLSDLAHYCKSDELAGNLKQEAGGNPRLQALAYGWISHAVGDSAAHPWVNGFVGSAFVGGNWRALVPGTVNHTHGVLEGWVARQYSGGMDSSVFTRSVSLYATDPDVARAVDAAYQRTYGRVFSGRTCENGGTYVNWEGFEFPIIRELNVQEKTVEAGRAMARLWRLGSFSDPGDFPLWMISQLPLIGETAPEYLGLTKGYLELSWAEGRAPRGFNLDLGINAGSQALEDDFGRLSSERFARTDVFPTPGTRFVAGGDKPPFEDKCTKITTDGDACLLSPPAAPGGDNPDDNVSAASPCLASQQPRMKDSERAFWRLALKKGEVWPAFAAQIQRLGLAVDAALAANDPVALGAAHDAIDRAAAEGSTASTTFKNSYATAGRPDATALYEAADVLLLYKGFPGAATTRIEVSEEPVKWVAPESLSGDLEARHPVLVVPSGGLYGLSQNDQFKVALDSYVAGGGAAIVFAQQRGSDFSVLPTPDGRPIQAYGWYEDNSCYTNGAYIENFHPILASQSQALVTSNIDGYFDGIPENATVLLRRVKNGLPSMFLYPYGQGWVVVTSSYDDWGGFNQAGPGARAIIRDAISWAKKPADLPINAPGSTVAITLQVKNVTELAASQVKLFLMSPSRDRVVVEQIVGRNVPPSGTAEVAFTHSFPANAELGIYHVDYELLDGAGVTVQPVAEDDTGRIVVARSPTAFRPGALTVSTSLPGGEDVLAGQPTVFRYRVFNPSSTERTVKLFWNVNLTRVGTDPALLDELVVPANSSVVRDATLTLTGSWLSGTSPQRFWLYAFEQGPPQSPPWWLAFFNFPPDAGAFQYQDSKGLELHIPRVHVRADGTVSAAPGQALTLPVTLVNTVPFQIAGRVEVRDEGSGTVVLDEPFSLEPSASRTVSLSFPAGLELGIVTYKVSTGALGGRAYASALVTAPEVWERGLVLPAWSLTSTNAIQWSLENVRTVPLTAGAARARLVDGGGTVLWETSQALTLGAYPNGAVVLTFEAPALPAGLDTGSLTLEADNGFGKTIERQVPVIRRLLAAVGVSRADFAAGESGEVAVTVRNQGTVVETGEVSGAIDGVAVLASLPLALSPGQQTVLRFPFTVPADVSGRLHRGTLGLPHGPPVAFTVSIRPPKLEIQVEDRVYTIREGVPVVLRNTGGSRANPAVTLDLDGRVRTTVVLPLDAGAEGVVTLPPLPLHLPTGSYVLRGEATDPVRGAHAALLRPIAVAGTVATLTVATDSDVYGPGAPLQATASVTNGERALAGGLLHLEIAPPCAGPTGGSSYHLETWDGASWVERAVRHRASFFETDVVDLGAYLPDGAGEYRVRIRQEGPSPAFLDHVALLSGGVLAPPTEATEEGGGDVLPDLLAADDQGPFVAGNAVVVRFPASPNPSLVFRAREGSGCERTAVWQKDVPLDLGAGAVRDVLETLAAPSFTGQYVLTGVVRTRDGDALARDEKAFEVVAGSLAVSLGTDATAYRTGAPVVASGLVRNLSSAAEPEVTLRLYRQSFGTLILVHEETLALGPAESRSYSVTFDAEPSSQDLMVLSAEVLSPSSTASSAWSVLVGDPQVSAELIVPDPALRPVSTGARPVDAVEADLDAVTHTGDGELVGALPFPFVLGGVPYVGFRQSVKGFVELVPEGGSPASGFAASCLSGFNAEAILAQIGSVHLDTAFLAAFLGDLDPGLSGFVGHKLYPAGTADRERRVFTEDTLVFFWEAPTAGDARRNRLQVLLSRSGLIRVDTGDVFLPETCPRTGLVLVRGEAFAIAPVAPFGVRMDSGIGRGPFGGLIRLQNSGPLAATVSVDYGRVGGTRSVEMVSLAPNETRGVRFQDSVTNPTTYSANLTGDAELQLEGMVTPSETLAVTYTGEVQLTPGPALLPMTVTKGGVGGPVAVTFALTGPSGPQTVTRTYDLEPGIPIADRIAMTIPEGSLTLAVTADVPLSSPPLALLSAPMERMAFTASAGAVTGGRLPISVDIANTGLSDFLGEVQVEGPGGSRTPVSVPGRASTHLDLEANFAGAPSGPQTFTVRLVSAGGVLVGEQQLEQEVVGPRVVLVQSPAGQSFAPASIASLPFVLRNTGDQASLGRFEFQVFDETHAAAFDLAPGSQTEVVFETRIEDDVEQKVYEGRYVIGTVGLPDSTGPVNFTVNGIALVVLGSLDQAAYADGETAHFTVDVTNGRPGLGTEYLARVHYGDFEEVRSLSVSGSATAVFDVPLPEVTGEPLFLGISHPDGRSLYINTYHVRRRDDLATVTLDAQIYAPGATVTMTATPASAGTLTLSAPGFTETIAATGAVTRSFALSADLPGGTYLVSWAFVSSAGADASGSVPFDVSGVRVRVFEARLDKGRYLSGESIQTRLQIHTNEGTTATLRAFILDPEGSSQLAGEAAVVLAPGADLLATHTWPFTSEVAGLHRLVYGIYRGEYLLASGSLAFDVGSGAVLSLRTDKPEYPSPTEAVQATVSAFVSGPVDLRLEVDGQTAATPEVTGTGMREIVAALPALPPGPHELTAVLEGGSYTSRRTTSFSTGTSLPDLSPGVPLLRMVSGSSARIDVTVENAGRAEVSATDLVVRDLGSGALLGSVTVPGLAAGSSVTVSADWNAAGAAGAHEVEVVADSGNGVQEFREDNNRSTASLDVPPLVFQATADSTYPANVDADLGGVVTNLSAGTTFAGLRILASVVRPDGSAIPLAPVSLGPVSPGASLAVGTPWAVGRSAPGAYFVQSQLVDAPGASRGTAAAAFEVLATPAFAGAVAATPNPAPAGGAVTLNGHILNQGNVAASGTARFDLLTPEGTVAARQRVAAEVPLEGAVDVSAVVEPLDLPPGEYGLDLRVEIADQEHPVATSALTVAGAGVQAVLDRDSTPRILVYVGGQAQDAAGRARRTAFVETSLAGTAAVWQTTSSLLDFARLFRSGSWNTYVVLTESPLLLPLLADELREAAHRGDGLVLVQWGTGRTVALDPALGAAVGSQQPGSTHTLQVLTGPLGPAQTIVVPGAASRLTLTGASLAATMGSSVPVLSTHGFGRGRTVAMAFDPAVPAGDPARPALLALFARAVGYVAPQHPRVVAPGVVLPLAVSLHHPLTTVQNVEVVLAPTDGVRIARLDDAPAATNPPTWQVSLPAGATVPLRFQVVLPNETGSYAIGTTVRVNGIAIAEPPPLTLEVAERWEDTHAAVIASLEARTVSAQDTLHLQAAIGLLRTAQPLGMDLLGLEARIRLAAEAAAGLGRITSADVSAERATVGRLIAAWERASYEAALPALQGREPAAEGQRSQSLPRALPSGQ